MNDTAVLVGGAALALVGLALLVWLLMSARRRSGVAEVRLPWGIEARMPTAVFIALVVFGAGLYVISRRLEQDGSPPGLAEVHLTAPAKGTVIARGDDVRLAGSVRGLGNDKLYLLRQFQPTGQYRILLPVAYQDGSWDKVDRHVGGDFKKPRNVTYALVQADSVCQQFLDRAGPYTETLGVGCETRQKVLIKVR
ncbi:MAG TPA: hypothetical protein VHC41_09210 [Mycobacteriales bacterium]|nr:hypothetical protein [Mycobacteriales bacterium]